MNIRPKKTLLNPDLIRPSHLNSNFRDPNYLWLDKNENLDPDLIKFSHQVFRKIDPICFAIYPESAELYRSIARMISVSPDQLFLAPGSDGVIRAVFEAFVEPGDIVMHTEPSFAMYAVYSKIFGAHTQLIEYEYTPTGPELNLAKLIKGLKKFKPKILCLPNPDSPTGTIVLPSALEEILAVCEEVGTVFLLDEAYHPFYEWTGSSWTDKTKNLIVARTFSKAWGAAGMRIGFAIANSSTIEILHKIKPMYEIGAVSVVFMTEMVKHVDQMLASVKRIQNAKEYFEREMHALGFSTLNTYGNFSHVAFAEHQSAIFEALSSKVLFRQSFNHPSLRGYSRFTIATISHMIKVVELIKLAVITPK